MSPSKPVVGLSEAVTLLFLFMAVKFFLTESSFIFHSGLNASWIVSLIITGYALCGVLLLSALLRRYPGRDLVEIGEILWGPYLNFVPALFYLFVFIGGAGFVLRVVGERMVSGFLPDSPISLVVFFFVMGSVLVSYLGIEAVARTARLLVGALVVGVIFLILLTIPLWEWHAIFPLLGGGPLALVSSSIAHSGEFSNILLLGILAPFLPLGTVRSVGIRGTLAAGLVLFISLMVGVLIFTYPLIMEISLPSMEMTKVINIGRFGRRLEVLFLPIWILGNFIYLSISFYAGAHVMARLCKLTDFRPFVLAAAVLTIVVAFIPSNAMSAASASNDSISHYGLLTLVAILILLLLTAQIRDRGGQKNDQKD